MLYCYNKVIIGIANNPIHHSRTKHIEIDHHFIKEKLDREMICLHYVQLESASRVLSVLVKGLIFSTFCSKMGLYDVFAPS